MARWLQYNPANGVNITDHTSVSGDKAGRDSVLKYANGRLKPNDVTRVYRDWAYEEIEWEPGFEPTSSVPVSWSKIDYVIPLNLVGGADSETLPYYMTLLRAGTPGSEYTAYGLLYQGSNGKWRHWASPTIGFRSWSDEGQAQLVTNRHDYDFCKIGGRYYVGSTGDPMCAKSEGTAGASVFYSHLGARMRQAADGVWSITRGLKIATLNRLTNTDIPGTLYYDGGFTTTTGGLPAGTTVFTVIGPSSGTPTYDDYVICGWDVTLFWFTEVYDWEDETLESEPRLIGWATGPSEGFWFYHKSGAGVKPAYDASAPDTLDYKAGDFPIYADPKVNIWPAPGSEQMLWNRDSDGDSLYTYNYKLVEDGNPANITASITPDYRIYATRLGVAATRSPNAHVATLIGSVQPRFYWDGFGSYTGVWSGGVYTPEDPDAADLTGKLDMRLGYDPQDPYIKAAEAWVQDEGPFEGVSVKANEPATPGVATTHYYDPLYAEQEATRFAMEQVSFGSGQGTSRYQKLKSPSRYIICEGFRDSLLSVPIDNRRVIEYSPAGDYANRPEPYQIPINTGQDDEIIAIKAYEQVALVFTRSHVLSLNYLPDEAVYQDEESVEVLCEGRTLTERAAISEVSFANSHWVAWIANEGIVVSDGRVTYNACPDFSLAALDFEMITGMTDRMCLINNIDDDRLELWLIGEQATQRWDFYYHDSHLINGRYFKLRGPTTLNQSGVKQIVWINNANNVSSRRGRALIITTGAKVLVQTENYSDDVIRCHWDKIWGPDPMDHVRLDGMIIEVPGDQGFTYKCLNYCNGHIEDTAAGKEEREMVLMPGAMMAKVEFEASSGQWVQPGWQVTTDQSIIETWVGRTWVQIDVPSDMAD